MRIAQNRLDDAEREARLAMTASADRILPRLTLAEVLEARGQDEQALAVLAEAEKLYGQRAAPDPELVQVRHWLRGKALADIGQVAPAEAEFQQEIRSFPTDPRAYSSLALLYALTGRAPESAAMMHEMTEKSPTAAAYAEAVRVYRALHDEQGAETVLRFARRKFPGAPELEEL